MKAPTRFVPTPRSRRSRTPDTARQAVLAYLEREACVVSRGHGGALREHGQGFLAAAFRHRTSRAQDRTCIPM
jgi:TrwC relaxase